MLKISISVAISVALVTSTAFAEESTTDEASPEDQLAVAGEPEADAPPEEAEPGEPEADTSPEQTEAAAETGGTSGDADEPETGEPSRGESESETDAAGLRLHLSAVAASRFGEGADGSGRDARHAEPFHTYRVRYRAGVALSIVGAIFAPLGGLGFSLGAWGEDVWLAIGFVSGALCTSALITGIVLAVRGLRGARRVLGVQGRLRMREMRRLVEDEDGHQLAMAQARPERTDDLRRSRRLELAGWIMFGIGLAAIAAGAPTYEGWDAGIALLTIGSVLGVIGLPMGAVGTHRRRRAETAQAMYLDEPMYGLEAAGTSSF